MKPIYLLTFVPIILALTGCQSLQSVAPGQDKELVGTGLTATPTGVVIYPDDRPSIPDGKVTYGQNCASCHGATGEGGGAGVNVKFDETWSHQIKPVDIYRLVAFGGPQHNHPKFNGQLSPRDMWNVTVYARSLGQPALTDEELALVDPVFGSNCAVCHGTKGDGDGPLARNLDPMPANFQRFDRFFNRTDDVLFDHIANGIRWEGMPNFLGKQDRKKNMKFDEPYIRKLVQYVHKFHVNNAPVLTAAAEAAGASPNLGTSTSTGTSTDTSTGTNAGAGATGITPTGSSQPTPATGTGTASDASKAPGVEPATPGAGQGAPSPGTGTPGGAPLMNEGGGATTGGAAKSTAKSGSPGAGKAADGQNKSTPNAGTASH